ncbi:MAG: tail fiber domain-containing protein [Terriglobia bacterium]
MRRPTRVFRMTFILLLLAVGLPFTAIAQSEPTAETSQTSVAPVPRLIQFNGVVRDRNGEPIGNVAVRLTFSVYEEPQGGTALWNEAQVIQLDEQGRYTVLLGATANTGVPVELFPAGKARWLGVQVENRDEDPRVLMVSVPYALKAEDAAKLGGKRASDFVLAEQLEQKVRTAVAVLMPAQTTAASTGKALAAAPAAAGGGAPKTTPATSFADTTTNQVVSVQQNGTGDALSAIVVSPTSGKAAVRGQATAVSGQTFGVHGASTSATGTGIFGYASSISTTAIPVGVGGQVNSATGVAGSFLTTDTNGKILSGRSGVAPGTEMFSVDGGGNVRANSYLDLNGFPTGTGGTVTSIMTGPGLTGGPIRTTGRLDLNTGYTDARYSQLVHTHPVGDVTGVATLGTNLFVGNQTVTGNLSLTGAISSNGLRIDTTADGPNILAGSSANYIAPGLHTVTISGGGEVLYPNRVTDVTSTIGGGAGNQAGDDAGTLDDACCATVAGGVFNKANAGGSTIGGGVNNIAAGPGWTSATIGGGDGNKASAWADTVAGGAGNTAKGGASTVAGGSGNTAGNWADSVGGGDQNIADGVFATVPGGFKNTAGFSSFAAGNRAKATSGGSFVWGDQTDADVTDAGWNSFVARATGGFRFITGVDASGTPLTAVNFESGSANLTTPGNVSAASFSGDGSGLTNIPSGALAFAPADLGGTNNFTADQSISGNLSVTGSINGGLVIQGSDPYGANFIAGTSGNYVVPDVQGAAIGGGGNAGLGFNRVTDDFSTVAGGVNNQAGDNAESADNAAFATVGGGADNTASGAKSTVAGGNHNEANSNDSTVGGGEHNLAGAYAATVPGGSYNQALGEHSFAAGYHAKAIEVGTFVWGDRSTDDDVSSTGNNQFVVRAQGGGFFSNDLMVGGTVAASGFSGDGSGLTNIPSGALAFAPAVLGGTNNFSGDQSISGNLTTTGQAGIGTLTPQRALDIRGSNPQIRLGGGGPNGIEFMEEDESGVGLSLLYRVAPQYMSIDRNGESLFTVLKSNGNVGVGTGAPGERLHVDGGSLRVNPDGTDYPQFVTGLNVNMDMPHGRAGLALHTAQGGIAYFGYSSPQLDQKDMVVLGTDNQQNDIGFFSNLDSVQGEDNLNISTKDPIMLIKGTGNVGIGTTAPTEKLEVAGNLKISGDGTGLIFPDGTTQTTASTGGGTATGLNCTDCVVDQQLGINYAGSGTKNGPATSALTALDATNAQMLGGQPATSFAQLTATNTFTGDQSISGNLDLTGTLRGQSDIQILNPSGTFRQLNFISSENKSMSLFFANDHGVVQTDPGTVAPLIFRTDGKDRMYIWTEGTISVPGSITAGSFSGDGSGLTGITTAATAANAEHATTAQTAETANTAQTATSALSANEALNAAALGNVPAATYARLDVGNDFNGKQGMYGNTDSEVLKVDQNGSGAALIAQQLNTDGVNAIRATNVSNSPAIYAVSSGNGSGVDGTSPTFGVRGMTDGPTGTGVYGEAHDTTGTTIGVKGHVESPAGVAGLFVNQQGGKILSGATGEGEKFRVEGSGNVWAAGGISAPSFTGSFSGNGAGLTNLNISNIPDAVTQGQLATEVGTLQAADSAESTARSGADITLQSNLNAEAVLRTNADTALQAAIDLRATTQGDNAFTGTQTVNGNLRVSGSINNALVFQSGYDSPNIIGGMSGNYVRWAYGGATIGGGGSATSGANRVTDDYGTVAGGADNEAGSNNDVFGDGAYAAVGGGQHNAASGRVSTVPGGEFNIAEGEGSLAAGFRARAIHNKTFVWSDGSRGEFSSSQPYTFNVSAIGGAFFSDDLHAGHFFGDGSGLVNVPVGTANNVNCTGCVSAAELNFTPAMPADVTTEASARQAGDTAEIGARTSADTALDLAKVSKVGDTMTGTLNLPSNGLTAGTDQLVLAGDKVGVGTASPVEKFQVAGGNALFDNALVVRKGVCIGPNCQAPQGVGESYFVVPGCTGTEYSSNYSDSHLGTWDGGGMLDMTTTGFILNQVLSRRNPGGACITPTAYSGFPDTIVLYRVMRDSVNLSSGDFVVPGNVAIGISNASNILTVKQASATDPIADAWTTYSSRRWKTNIQTIHAALSTVERLRGVTYDAKADGQHNIGLIAEEVGEVVPEVVTYEANGVDAKSVDYARLTALLVEAVKEQQAQIRELKSQIEQLNKVVRINSEIATR